MKELSLNLIFIVAFIAFGYFLFLNIVYAFLLFLASVDARRYYKKLPYVNYDDIFSSPLTPGISMIVPAHNEEAVIVESVRSMLGMTYPLFEIVVVDDGSTDDTFGVLEREYDLVPSPRVVSNDVHLLGEIFAVYEPSGSEPIVVVRKIGAGKKTDSNNAGINAARHPLVCLVDADSILDQNALLHVVKPFVDNPEKVIATGGSVRVVNGSQVDHGRVLEPLIPHGWLERIQVVEYLRAFLLGRAGWSHLKSLLIISGAFGLFRRDLLVDVGGYDQNSMGEDAELIARIHYLLQKRKQEYEIVFVTEPVCWTEVPSTFSSLASQRSRWSRGLAETLWKHKSMMFNPRFGRIGTIVLPYFLLIECLGPVFEILGVLAIVLAAVFGVISLQYVIIFAIIAFGLGIFLSVVSIAVEEFTYQKYRGWKGLVAVFAASVLENFGYRQLHAWWRLKGLYHALRKSDSSWQVLPRSGFNQVDVEELRDIAQ